MGVALTALVVALGGSAIGAVGGESENASGVIQACVADKPLVHRVGDGVDAATGGLSSPATDATDAVADGVDDLTNGAVSGVTEPVVPKGVLLIPDAGEGCPKGSSPQEIAVRGTPTVVESKSSGPAQLGKDKVDVATAELTEAGEYLVDGVAQIVAPGIADRPMMIKCALVGPDGTIPFTTQTITVPANSLVNRYSIPIHKLVALPAGATIASDCKVVVASAPMTAPRRPALAPRRTRPATARSHPPMPPANREATTMSPR